MPTHNTKLTAHDKDAHAATSSEHKYQQIVEDTLQGITIIQDERFVYCNGTYAALIGYAVEELLSMPSGGWIRLVHPEDRNFLVNQLQSRQSGKKARPRYEFRGLRKDGKEVFVIAYDRLIKHKGKPAVQMFCLDISDRKRAEESLQQSERLLNDILDGCPIPQLVIDSDHRVIKWNRALEQYSGIKAEEVVGTDLQWKSYYREKRPILADLLVDGISSENAGLYPQGYVKSKLFDSAYEATDVRDGRWLRGTASAIRNSQGNVIGAVETLEDITEQKRAEEKLKESLDWQRAIFEGSRDAILVCNSQSMIVDANLMAVGLTGYSRDELLALQASALYQPKELAAFEDRHQRVLAGEDILCETTIHTKNGTALDVELGHKLIVMNDMRFIYTIMRNITTQNQLKAQFYQAQKMEAVGVLAGGVAHDFNNLLCVISGYCEMLLSNIPENDPKRLELGQIRLAGKRAASLTSQLLAFSRKQILQPELIDLNSVVDGMSSMLRRLIREDIELQTIACPDLGSVCVDPGQIQQVIMNLVVNARDAMPEGGKITIETANMSFDAEYLRTHPIAKPGFYVMLAISDNGMGMNHETLAHVFEPFFTTKEKGKGTGLGLSTVYGIVKQSKGFIWVYSELGQGTTFKIYFPLAEGHASKIPQDSAAEHHRCGSETLLIAEDEASLRSFVCRILREHGYSVLEASNGTEALRMAKKHPGVIHMIISDVIMPEMGGKTLVAKLRMVRPTTKALFVSGYADNAIVHHGILDSGIAFLQKPFTTDSLLRKVREVLDEH